MSTSFLSPGWRMPTNKNQSKQANYSLERNGTGQYVQSDNIPFNSGPSWTISCWVKGANLTSGTTEAFYGTQYYGTTTGGFVIYFKNGGLTFYSSLPGSGSYFTIATATGLLSNNEWQQFVIRYNYGVDYRVYVNNVLRGVNTLNNTKIWPEQNIRLFRHYANDGYSYIGEMTDWCFFNYALSDTSTTVGDTATDQVAAIYGDGSSLPNPMALPNPPIAYYPLGTSAWNGNFLAENNAIGDYVFEIGAYPRLINTGTIADLNSNMAELSVSIWFKKTGGTRTNDYAILSKVGANTPTSFSLFWKRDSLATQGVNTAFKINNGSVQAVGGQSNTGNEVPITIEDNKWYNLVGTYNGTTQSLYINGVLHDFKSTTGNIVGVSGNALLGADSTIASYNWLGELSNSMIWTKGLSQSEVTTLYNYGSPIQTLASIPQSSNLKLWYKLDASEVYNSTTTEWSVDNNQNPSAYPSSLDFDSASSQRIDVGTINLASNWSISIWVNWTYIYASRTAFGGSNGLLQYSPQTSSSGGLMMYPDDTTNNYFNVTPAINDGKWHNVVFSYDNSTTTLNTYTDGSLSDSRVNTASATNFQYIGVGYFYWLGKLSNCSIWNTNLSATQVTELYNNGTPSNLSSHSATSNLVSWWKLNNTTTGIEDSKGSNNGTNNGATEYAGFVNTLAGDSSGMSQANLVQSDLQTVAPYSKYAISFDGTDSLTVGSLFGQVQDVFSVSTWVNFTSNPGYQVILSDNIWLANYTANNIGLDIKNSSGNYYDGNGGLIQGTNFVIPSDLRTNKWINVAFSYVGSSSGTTAVIKMYLNGAEVVSTTVTYSNGNANLQNASNVYLGSRNGSSQYLNGSLSNLSIWNYALTASQVREIYNQGLPSDLNTFSGTAPVAWWQLGENSSYVSGWTFADEIASNNGTSGNLPETALTNGVGTTANGVSTGMGVEALIGDAPYSTANAISSNMSVLAKGTDPADIPS